MKYKKQNKTILVFGDIMLDQYWDGDASRVSPEAPVPVVSLNTISNTLGGAGNVAANIASLDGKVKLLSIVGNDQNAKILDDLLKQKKIDANFIKISDYPTTTKLRITSSSQQLLRVDTEEKLNLCKENADKLQDKYSELLKDVDAVILSDYAKGCLTQIKDFIKIAKSNDKLVFVDPKLDDFSYYSGIDYITPNLKEIEKVVGKVKDDKDLEKKVKNLIAELNIKNFIVTKGSKGVSIITKDSEAIHLEATSSAVYDVTGAGDTVIAALAHFITSGLDIKQSVTLSNYAAGIVVSKPGTSVATIEEVKDKTQGKISIKTGVVPEKELLDTIRFCQTRGEKVIFTNGCYDVIHHGHINYLERAKSLGDRLIIGVNSDESIRRLKGKNRPINNLDERMKVLSSLKAVDWVVPFYEDTPGKLVEKLMPDALVKTTETFKKVEDVPESEGAKTVLENGGKIFLLARTEGTSSTDIIKRSELEEI